MINQVKYKAHNVPKLLYVNVRVEKGIIQFTLDRDPIPVSDFIIFYRSQIEIGYDKDLNKRFLKIWMDEQTNIR